MANEINNRDVANSLSKYSDINNKGINAILDGSNQINKWYENKLNEITENKDVADSRIETNIDNQEETTEKPETSSKIETKAPEYNEIQTNNKTDRSIINKNRVKTRSR